MGGLMELRYRMMMDSIPDYLRLPSDYEKRPYVTADGNQVIRTDYIPDRYDEFHLRLMNVGVNGTLLSVGSGTYQIVMIGGSGGAGWYYRYFSSSTLPVAADYVSGVWYDADIDTNGTLHTNGKMFTCPYEAPLDGTATNLYLFERRNWTQRYTGSLSEFWIKNNG